MAFEQSLGIAQAFDENLYRVYGRFRSRQLGPNSDFRISCDETNFLQPVRVLAKSLLSHRHVDGLKPEWHDKFFIMQQLSGQMRVSCDEHLGLMRSNDLMLLDNTSAYEFLSARSSESMLIPFRYDFVDQPKLVLASCGQRIDGSSGIGQVLSSTLSALMKQRTPACRIDREAMTDAVRILLTRVVERVPSLPPPGDCSSQLARAETFALAELANPALGPGAVADFIGISRRQLYRLFADHDTTPAAWIWTLRIREAKARLISASWAGQSLTQIAFDLGFNDMAHFSRLYRAHFGASPREHRRINRGTDNQGRVA